MFLNFMHKNIVIANIELIPCLGGHVIKMFKTLREELLPQELMVMKGYSASDRSDLFALWLEKRAIPNSRTNIDSALIRLYDLKEFEHGRMYGYQHTGALLCHYMSMEDDYWINPLRTEAVSHVYEEPLFNNLYFLRPSSYEHLLWLRQHPDTDTGKILIGDKNVSTWHIDGLDFTIQSSNPSRWSLVDGKVVLLQAEC